MHSMKNALEQVIKSKNSKEIIAYLGQNKKTILNLVIAFIFVDIFFIKISSDLMIFSIIFLYGIFIKIFQIDSRRTFLLCLFLLVAMFINYLQGGSSNQTEKAAVWLVLFLVIGIIQQWKE